ncbi:peptidoglycan DD-metalloendopeptidase family protein [Mollicutes bacterium LVI A0039]|nr:peptidoglycan DD-metalloendopeptidase family protein [Mollicutes bacterium LVI A0039]
MQANGNKKNSIKIYIIKICLLVFVSLLLFIYARYEYDIQSFTLLETAYLYEGDELVGVNNGVNASKLADEQSKKADQVISEANVEEGTFDLSTKVVSVPSLIKFTLTDEEQNKTIDYAMQQTKVLEDGYTISIDDNYKFYIKDLDTMEWTIDKMLLAYMPDSSYLDYFHNTGKFKPYTEADKTYTSIDIENEIKITEGYTAGSKYIDNPEDILFALFHNEQFPTYEYISNETSISSIKKDLEISDTEFKLNNPNISVDSITYNGQEIVVTPVNPIIDVAQTYETTETKEVEFETIEEVDKDLAMGETKIKTEGKVGKKEITYESKMINGEVVSTQKIDEVVTEAPVHEVILIGEKQVSSGLPSGSVDGDFTPSGEESSGFIWPSSSTRVTCEVGCYAGHTGIDIQSYYGGPIYAVKEGVVTTAGWSSGGYGYYVIINHGGGVQTLYAHQSQQPPVKVGDTVTQGQVIGFEGATGNVTGEHLHFEVHINGTKVNPRGYI